MSRLSSLVIGLVSAVVVALLPSGAFASEARQTYLLMPAPGAEQQLQSELRSIFEMPEATFTSVDNLLLVDLLPSDALALSQNPAVSFIELDQAVTISDTQAPTPSWGLDRIDGGLNSSFSYPTSAGEGVVAYVFDTGVDATHPDLAGRVSQGFDVIGNNEANTDCHYHGTHVAGTIAGTQFGVAKDASVVPLRVLNCSGSGSYSGVIRAINWVIATHPAGTPAVANLSLGGPKSSAVNLAIAAMVEAGIPTFVAAGNSYTDACSASPASTPEAITVGATDRFDNKAGFSNFGDCVDVFGPGVSIVSANAKNHASPTSLSGTSMAAPHLAGIGALILSENPGANASQVEDQIYRLSIPGAVGNSRTVRGNRLAQSPTETTDKIPSQPGAPTGLVSTESGLGSVSFSWNAVAQATSYVVEWRAESQNSFTRQSVDDTAFTVRGLAGGELAYLRVSAVSNIGPSTFSALASGRSIAQAPSAPLNLFATPSSPSATVLNWSMPVLNGGGGAIRYLVEENLGSGWKQISSTASNTISLSAISTIRSYRVLASTSAGVSAPSNEVQFNPATIFAVTSLVAEQRFGTSATISWASNAPAGSVFEVVLSRVGSSLSPVSRQVTTTNTTFTGLSKLTSYSVRVVPLGEVRGIAAQTTFATSASLPAAPRSQSVVKTNDGFRITFLAPSDNGGQSITGYRLEKAVENQWVDQGTSMNLAFTVPAPAKGLSVDYRLIAINPVGESPASSTLRVTTPGEAPTSPRNLEGVLGADGRVALSWTEPADLGGSPITGYRIETLRSGVWSLLATVTGTASTFTTSAIAKGTTASYRVAATNRFGTSISSESNAVERAATAPGDVSSISISATQDAISFRWSAPSDQGGSSITGYELQQKMDSGWAIVEELGLVLTHSIAPGTPGEIATFRVVAKNAVGTSLSGAERTVTMPFQLPSAPSNLVVTQQGSVLDLRWSAPESSGGSPLSYYAISSSVDGAPFRQISTVRADQPFTRLTVTNKAVPVTFRVQAASTRAGLGLPSAEVTIDIPATSPSDPASISAQVVAGTGVRIAWLSPRDNGGKQVTGYRIESRVGSASWQAVGESSELVYLAPMPQAGLTVSYRVLAVNEVGASVGSMTATVRTNVAPATPPLALSSNQVGTSHVLSWSAPEVMGGSLSFYLVEFSDGGEFRRLTSTRALSTQAAMPAPNQTRSYRVAAFTNAGLGAWSETFSITAPKTVPGNPSFLSLSSNATELVATWRTAGVANGGVELKSAVLYRQTPDGFVKVAEAPASDLRIVIPNELHGELHYYSLRFTNEVGESAGSRLSGHRHNYAVANAPTNVAVTQEGSNVRVSWRSPSFIGGSPLTYAEVHSSADGENWTRLNFIRYAETAVVRAPAKGQTLQYRVVVRNRSGNSLPSEPVSYSAPLTAASADFSIYASRSGNQALFQIYSPSDFGGYGQLTVLIERAGSLAWQSGAENVLTRPRTWHTFNVELPQARGTYTYRVTVLNPSGEVEKSYTFRY